MDKEQLLATIPAEILDALTTVPSLALLLLAIAVAAGAGAVAAVSLADARQRRDDDIKLLNSVNVTIALLVALLGRLINVKRDQVIPAQENALAAGEALAEQTESGEPRRVNLKMEPWVEIDYRVNMPDREVFARAGKQLDTVQLLVLLDFSLADLCHLVRQRNQLIATLTEKHREKGSMSADGIQQYMRLCANIGRLTDENLFFIDKSIEKLRGLAQKALPASLHGRIADVGLRDDTGPLMPPRNLIKTFE